MSETAVAPVGVNERVATLDVLRGIAICGILPVNMLVMGTVGGNDSLTRPSHWNADWLSWGIIQAVLEGPSRGLFAMLFGAGVLLMLSRIEGGSERAAARFDVWSRRCVSLLVLGVAQFAILLWPGEILWTYGVSGLVLPAFRTSRPRTLFALAAVILLGLSALRVSTSLPTAHALEIAVVAQRAKTSGSTLTSAQSAALETLAAVRAANHPTADAKLAERATRTHLASLWSWSLSGWIDRHLATFSWAGVAATVAFMLVGMGLYRTGVLTGQAPDRAYWLAVVLGYGLGLGVRLADLGWRARTGFEIDITTYSAVPGLLRSALYEPARLAVTMGHLGAVVLLFRSGALGRARPLKALGRMALTTYTLQSAITSAMFYGCGLLGVFGPAGLLGFSVAIWAVTALFSLLWLRRFPMGPAEWWLRRWIYGRSSRADQRAVPSVAG